MAIERWNAKEPALCQVAGAQGAFYALTGIWPLVSIRSFERVTGPKLERWLVKTVGLLAAVFGSSLAVGARRGHVERELAQLGVGCALAFAAIDVVYVAQRRISPIYLADAVLELGLAGGWIWAGRRALGGALRQKARGGMQPPVERAREYVAQPSFSPGVAPQL